MSSESHLSDKDEKVLEVQDLGAIDYNDAWGYQTTLHKHLIKRKREAEYRATLLDGDKYAHYLLLCEHNPVFTLGKSGKESNVLLDEGELHDKGIVFNKINRGGDITYHGPGQIVGYPILDLDDFFTDVHKYVRCLEEVVIRVLADYGIEGYREKDYTGVWVTTDSAPRRRKICAIGVHLSRWVSMHGFAFNIENDLTPFSYIVPCGINDPDRTVCNLNDLTSQKVSVEEVKDAVVHHFSEVFQVKTRDGKPYLLSTNI